MGVRQHKDEAAFTEADIGEKDSQMHKGSKASQTSTSKKRKRKGRSGKGFAGKGKSAKSHKKRQKSKKRKATTNQGKTDPPAKREPIKIKDEEKLKRQKEDVHNQVKRLESKVTKLPKESTTMEKERADKGRSFRKGKANSLWDTQLYSNLRDIRQRAKSIERDLAENRKDLVDARSQLYVLEMKLLGKRC